MDWKKTAMVTIRRLKRSFIVVFLFQSWRTCHLRLLISENWAVKQDTVPYFNLSCLDVIQRFFIFSFAYFFLVTCCFSPFNLVVVSIPDPVALYPLNSEYQTREANNRQPMGTTGTNVSLAPGPEGEPLSSYQFSGQDDGYIEFPNNGGLNVKHSMTMLCWVYMETSGVSGPLFSYNNAAWGIRLRINYGKLRTRFKKNAHSTTDPPLEPKLWHYVGSSYNNETGKACLWLNGTKVEEKDIGAGITLATEQFARMGATTKPGKERFKGRVTAMQVYNVALTAEQINEVKDAGRGEELTNVCYSSIRALFFFIVVIRTFLKEVGSCTRALLHTQQKVTTR